MQWLLVSAAVLALSARSLAAPPASTEDDLLEQFSLHVNRLAAAPCLAPQPRVLRLRKLLPAHNVTGKVYFPDRTVLQRCDDSCGSCPPGQSCGPLHSDFVRLPFSVTYLEDSHSHPAGSWGWESLLLPNHTFCTCYDEKHLTALPL